MSEIRLTESQSEVFSSLFGPSTDCRYGVLSAGRGFGKSYLLAAMGVQAVSELIPMDVKNKNVTLIAPTYSQCMEIYMPLLQYEFGLDSRCKGFSRPEGRFTFSGTGGDVVLKLRSYEAAERIRGTGQYFVGLDEVTTYTGMPGLRELWDSIIRPAIVTRHSDLGKAMFISTPRGYDDFYDYWLNGNNPEEPEWKSWKFSTADGGWVTEAELEKAKRTMDYLKYNREILADFATSGAQVFYNFQRDTHVVDLEPFGKGEDVHVAIDFNYSIMAACAFALRGDQMHFLNDFSGHNDTEELSKALRKRYGKARKIITYPDPSGRARHTSSATGRTDFSILRSHGFEVRARTRAPSLVDSVQAVNTKLKTADGNATMFFSPKCARYLVPSMERTVWKEKESDSVSIDKDQGVEHWSDGVRYATEYLFQVRARTKSSAQGFMF